MKKLFLFCILHYGLVLLAQDPALLSKKADQFYRDSQFVEAEEFYRKADHAKIHYFMLFCASPFLFWGQFFPCFLQLKINLI